LQSSGLKVETRRVASGSVPPGTAISSPNSGQVLPSGSTVELLISRGE
jgi:beta-lactam-binding protein with PASTA domain